MVDLNKEINFKLSETMPQYADNEDFQRTLKEVTARKSRNLDLKSRIPVLQISFDSCVVVIGLPKVPGDKISKLQGFILDKLLPNNGFNKEEVESIRFETDAEGATLGSAIFMMRETEKALEFSASVDGLKFDSKHTLSALPLAKLEDLLAEKRKDAGGEVSEKQLVKWRQNADVSVPFIAHNNIRAQMMNFSVLEKNLGEPKTVNFGGKISGVSFSPSGDLLVLLQANGFEIRGGSEFSVLREFQHKAVKSVLFSPSESYVASFNGSVSETKDIENLVIWDVLTGEKLRAFKLVDASVFNCSGFSHDEKFFATLAESRGEKLACVYEMPSVDLLKDPTSGQKRPLDVKNPISLAWARTRAHIAVLSEGETPVIRIFDVPGLTRVPWIKLIHPVVAGSLQWSVNDQFLIADMTVRIKKKKNKLLEVGRIDFSAQQAFVHVSPSVPADSNTLRFSPNGEYFAHIAEEDKKFRIKMGVFEVQPSGVKESIVLEIPGQTFSEVQFSPQSKFVIFEEKSRKNLRFCEYKKAEGRPTFRMLRELTVPSYDSAEWSSCGRFIMMKKKLENNLDVIVYDCFGNEVFQKTFKKFENACFRSFTLDLETLFSTEELKAIKSKVRKAFEEKFREDQEKINRHSEKIRAEKIAKFDEFKAFLEARHKWIDENEEAKKLIDKEFLKGKKTEVRERIDKEEPLEDVRETN